MSSVLGKYAQPVGIITHRPSDRDCHDPKFPNESSIQQQVILP